MDSYLHVRIRDITETDFQAGDINISGTRDITVRIIYQGYIQDSKIVHGELQTISINEALILENAKPALDETLRIEVWDVDQCSNDDLLGVAMYIYIRESE